MRRSALLKRVFALVLSVGSFCVASPMAWSQVKVATLEEMRQRVSIGDKVVLVRNSGESYTGRLLRFDETDVEVQVEVNLSGQRQRIVNTSIPHGVIRSLDRKRDASKGTWIGLGIGAGVGGVFFASAFAKDANEVDEWASSYVLFGAILAGGGALIGRAFDHSKPHLRYESVSASTWRFDAAPIYQADRRGVKVAIRF
jgi:hypothetical protein